MEWSFPAQLHYLLYSPTTPIAAIDQISCIAKDHGQQVRSSSWRQIQIQRMILSPTAATMSSNNEQPPKQLPKQQHKAAAQSSSTKQSRSRQSRVGADKAVHSHIVLLQKAEKLWEQQELFVTLAV